MKDQQDFTLQDDLGIREVIAFFVSLIVSICVLIVCKLVLLPIMTAKGFPWYLSTIFILVAFVVTFLTLLYSTLKIASYTQK